MEEGPAPCTFGVPIHGPSRTSGDPAQGGNLSTAQPLPSALCEKQTVHTTQGPQSG